MVQPVAITFEDFAIHIAKELGFRPCGKFAVFDPKSTAIANFFFLFGIAATRIVGHVWVLGFLSFSLRFPASYAFQLGVGSVENPLIWSTADRVL
jgi:hypothetical protein